MSLYLLLVALLPNSGARAVNFLALVEIVFIARYSSIVRGTYSSVKRDLQQCQKRPISVSKETCIHRALQFYRARVGRFSCAHHTPLFEL
jgi:hypothetical protein